MLALLQLVTVVVCFLKVAGGASGAVLKEEVWLFHLHTVCCAVSVVVDQELHKLEWKLAETLHLLTCPIMVYVLFLDL